MCIGIRYHGTHADHTKLNCQKMKIILKPPIVCIANLNLIARLQMSSSFDSNAEYCWCARL